MENRELILQSKQLIQALSNSLEKTQKALEAEKEKNKTYEVMTNTERWFTMKEVADSIGYKNWGRNNIMKFLRKKNVFTENNQAYRTYIERGYFKTIEKYDERLDTIIPVPVTSTKGIDYIRRLIDKEIENG